MNRPDDAGDIDVAKEAAVAKRRLEITFERERLLVISRRRVSVRAWCEGCGRRSLLTTPEGAAEASGLTARAVYRRVEAGEVHFTETEDGTLLVCCDSLHESGRTIDTNRIGGESWTG
jgi:hypothetical protein